MNTVEMARHEKMMYLRGIDDCDEKIGAIMDGIRAVHATGDAYRMRLQCAKLARWIKRRKRYMVCRDRAERAEKNVD